MRNEPAKATRAVAAHFGFTSVGIVIAKTEIRAFLRGFHGQQAVRADASVAIAERGDGIAIQFGCEREVAVINDDEIVAGTIHFEEVEEHRGREFASQGAPGSWKRAGDAQSEISSRLFAGAIAIAVVAAATPEDREHSIGNRSCEKRAADQTGCASDTRWLMTEIAKARCRVGSASGELASRLIGQVAGAVRQGFLGSMGEQVGNIVTQVRDIVADPLEDIGTAAVGE